jgi:hypothetical protein
MEKRNSTSYERRLKGGSKPASYWLDDDTKEAFTALVKLYDPELSVAKAVVKLIKKALDENWLPGYIRKEKVIDNEMVRTITRMETKIDH